MNTTISNTSIETVDELVTGANYRVRGGNWLGSPVLAFEGRYMGTNVMNNTAVFEISDWQQIVFRADTLNEQMQAAEVIVFPIS